MDGVLLPARLGRRWRTPVRPGPPASGLTERRALARLTEGVLLCGERTDDDDGLAGLLLCVPLVAGHDVSVLNLYLEPLLTT